MTIAAFLGVGEGVEAAEVRLRVRRAVVGAVALVAVVVVRCEKPAAGALRA